MFLERDEVKCFVDDVFDDAFERFNAFFETKAMQLELTVLV